MKVKKQVTMSWEEAPDVITPSELAEICGIGKAKAVEIFNLKDFPSIPTFPQKAEKEAVKLYLRGIKIKGDNKSAINFLILQELQKLNKNIEDRKEVVK